MTLEEIIKAIVDYENEACEDFWDDNPEISNKANETDFFKWLKKNNPDDFNFILNQLIEYRKNGGKDIITIGLSSKIEPIEKKLLDKKIDLSSMFWELILEMDPIVYKKYLDRYKSLSSIIYNFEEQLKHRLLSIFFCEYLVKSGHPLANEIIKINDEPTPATTTSIDEFFNGIEWGLKLGLEDSVVFAIKELEKCSLSITEKMQLDAYKATYKDILRQFDEETKRFVEATRKHPDMDIYEIPEINDFMKDADAEKITAYFNNSIRKGY